MISLEDLMKNNELNFQEGKEKSIVNTRDGKRYLIEWFENIEFSNLGFVKQVYGYVFDDKGQLLITNPKSTWRLPGGGPESKDKNHEETLIREALEEADAIIEDIKPLGYMKITPLNQDSGEDIHYALRYVAKLKELREQTIDEAIGEIGERLLINPEEFSNYCNWGEMGLHVLSRAKEVFERSNEK